jgi:hypothetical protein
LKGFCTELKHSQLLQPLFTTSSQLSDILLTTKQTPTPSGKVRTNTKLKEFKNMKKSLIIGAVIGALVVALGATDVVFAQTQTPADPAAPYGGFGPGGRGNGFGAGTLGGGFQAGQLADGTEGPLHDYMVNALAEAFGMQPEAIEAGHAAGQTLWQIAQEKGISVEDFRTLMIDARTKALNQAVVDTVITQEQADWMLSRMNRGLANGFAPGSGTCDGTGPHGAGMRAGGFRWSNP